MAELLPLGAAVAGGHCGGEGWGGGRRSGPGRELEAPHHTHIQEPELHPGGGGREGF